MKKYTEEKLTAYALGELQDFEKKEVETYLAQNLDAKKFVDEIQALALELKTDLKNEPIPQGDGFSPPVFAAEKSSNFYLYAAICAAVVLALVPVGKKLYTKISSQNQKVEMVEEAVQEPDQKFAVTPTPIAPTTQGQSFNLTLIIQRSFEAPESAKTLIFEKGTLSQSLTADLSRKSAPYCAINNHTQNPLRFNPETITVQALESKAPSQDKKRFLLREREDYDFFCDLPEREIYQIEEFASEVAAQLKGWIKVEFNGAGKNDPFKLSLMD